MPSRPDASRDFDFQIGTWAVKHRRLKEHLADCNDWEAFDGTCTMATVLGGHGNVEDNHPHIAKHSGRPAHTSRCLIAAIHSPDSVMAKMLRERSTGLPCENRER
jgi:hypothetical protein